MTSKCGSHCHVVETKGSCTNAGNNSITTDFPCPARHDSTQENTGGGLISLIVKIWFGQLPELRGALQN